MGVSRRRFVQSVLLGAAALAGRTATAAVRPAGAAWYHAPWSADARAIVSSGALGAVRWIEASYPAGALQHERDWARHAAPLLAAIGLDTPECHTVALGGDCPTVVVEAAGSPPLFLAPRARGERQPAVVRGTTASLLIRDGELWLRPEAPRGDARRAAKR